MENVTWRSPFLFSFFIMIDIYFSLDRTDGVPLFTLQQPCESFRFRVRCSRLSAVRKASFR